MAVDPLTLPITTPAGSLTPGLRYDLTLRHGDAVPGHDHVLSNVLVRAFFDDAGTVRYEAIGDETIGFLAEHVSQLTLRI